jgi:hypothetical protein
MATPSLPSVPKGDCAGSGKESDDLTGGHDRGCVKVRRANAIGPTLVGFDGSPRELLGHTQIGITLDLYSHVTATMQRDVVTAFQGLLGSTEGSKSGSE